MTANDVLRSVTNALPPETRMTGFLDILKEVMRRIRARGEWSFGWTRGQIDLVASYDTGTIAIDNAETTVTGTGTMFTADMVGRKIRISGVAYVIDSWAGDTSIELATNYGGATETAASFVIYQDEYALAAGAQNIHRMWDKQNSHKLAGITPIAMGDKDFRTLASGTVDEYAVVGLNSSDARLVQFHPYPTAIARVEYWYQADITQVSGIGSTVDVPAFFDELVKAGALAGMLHRLRVADWRDEDRYFRERLEEAWIADSPLRDVKVRMARDDLLDATRFLIRTQKNVTV